MLIREFLKLNYEDELKLINQSGKLLRIIVNDEYQMSLYEVKDIYVELKRKHREFTFDSIVAMNHEDIPSAYK